ncbi:MAG: hypothetical protein QXX58_03355 [Thermofilaceae archaeon]
MAGSKLVYAHIAAAALAAVVLALASIGAAGGEELGSEQRGDVDAPYPPLRLKTILSSSRP